MRRTKLAPPLLLLPIALSVLIGSVLPPLPAAAAELNGDSALPMYEFLDPDSDWRTKVYKFHLSAVTPLAATGDRGNFLIVGDRMYYRLTITSSSSARSLCPKSDGLPSRKPLGDGTRAMRRPRHDFASQCKQPPCSAGNEEVVLVFPGRGRKQHASPASTFFYTFGVRESAATYSIRNA